MTSHIYDLIIIGSGPAGLAAAVYAQRACLDTLIIERSTVSGGQILNTYEVDNYPGYPGISGYELGMKLREHADHLGAQFKEDTVLKIEDKGLENLKQECLTFYERLLLQGSVSLPHSFHSFQ